MYKIIDCKRYDTETANQIASVGNGYGSSDFKYQLETLYCTDSGAWFLYGEGGALSDYGEWHGNTGTDGEGIRVMTAEEAYTWLELHQQLEPIERHFSDRITDA